MDNQDHRSRRPTPGAPRPRHESKDYSSHSAALTGHAKGGRASPSRAGPNDSVLTNPFKTGGYDEGILRGGANRRESSMNTGGTPLHPEARNIDSTGPVGSVNDVT